MAAIDYAGIKVAMKALFDGDATLQAIRETFTDVEAELLISPERTPWIGIYGESRDVDHEPLASGRRLFYRYLITVRVSAYDPENLAAAAKLRDDIIGQAEIVLLQNRTLSGTVTTLRLEGGEMMSGQVPEDLGFLADGVIEVRTVVSMVG